MDLSADMGEWTGPVVPASELELLEVVTTAHVACGAHAGDPGSMRRMAAAAAAAGVVVGAHPSYPDREGFGRRPMGLSVEEVATCVATQVGTLQEIARSEGAAVRSVKPHGALYHRLATDAECARAVAGALARLDGSLAVVGPAGSATEEVVRRAGLATVAEGFCDRAYRPDGALVARSEPRSLITDPQGAAHQALSIAREGRATSIDGAPVTVRCESLCVHGDTPGAAAIAREVRRALARAGVPVAAACG